MPGGDIRKLAEEAQVAILQETKANARDTMAFFTGILFQWRSPISKQRKRNWANVRN